MNLPAMPKHPSAFLPVAMSLAALAAVSKTGAEGSRSRSSGAGVFAEYDVFPLVTCNRL
jgi:hypothetical protein